MRQFIFRLHTQENAIHVQKMFADKGYKCEIQKIGLSYSLIFTLETHAEYTKCIRSVFI